MIVPELVDRVKVCEPIRNFLRQALNLGYEIKHQELEDYHFSQLRFIIKSSVIPEKALQLTGGISHPKSNTYTCDCHWSKVEIAT